MVQVVTFGHQLSNATRDFLKSQYGQYQIFNVPFHIPKFYQTLEKVEEAVEALIQKGFRFHSHDPILLLLPGSCVGAAAILAAFKGACGQLPFILNVIKSNQGYIPCQELPILDLCRFSQGQRQSARGRKFSVEVVNA